MEILSNFSSAYGFISFILGALFMLTMLCISAMGKVQEQCNNVHFYVARDKDGKLFLYMGKPIRKVGILFDCGERDVPISASAASFFLKSPLSVLGAGGASRGALWAGRNRSKWGK